MKREAQAREVEPEVAEPEVQVEAAQAAESSEVFVADGEVPAVTEEAAVAAAEPTASEQAFEDAASADQKEVKAAEGFNEDHPHRIAEFNQLTESSCMKHGKLDIEKVRDFQKAAHLEADGKVNVWTLAAAKRSAEIREKNKADEEAAEARTNPKKVEPQPKQPEVIAAPEIVAAPVAKIEDKPKETVPAAPEVVKGGESKHQAAIEFNERHAALVAEFNQVTNFACTLGGTVDVEKVMEFQIAHGCKADGRIDAQTLAAAQKTAEPITAAEVEAAPVEAVQTQA